MKIGGLVKSSLLDWPGKLTAVVFTVGCNFRCPFCHNRDLVTAELFRKSGLEEIGGEEVFEFLEKKRKLLDGVVITGGEPTIQKDLGEFCERVKKLGFLVKLDTNGSNPEVIEQLIRSKYIDYVAMDYKTRFEEYAQIVNFKFQILNFKKIIKLLNSVKIGFELRTTAVPGIHDLEILKKMGSEIESGIWYWQDFRPENCLDEKYLKKKGFGKEKLEEWREEVQKKAKGVRIEIR
ncbi:MAG: anaerobic ribonucleoside-triphosphate reductase activating protein [Candidatus Shapirobacteria bacterium]